ncbi:hypothetical protein CHS0354_032045 [Potamilus streckersoni]|uniref:Uncharacterized protein n=1 Tax=Potamilus streckersoni TaxID=2493646 RepID=A0AAE0WHL7_9BIVA|nr:hypothetical protein CHS0354_032045 [Potamilus streckersoni]
MGMDLKVFEGEVDDDLICGLCRKVLLDPITAGCSHIFCRSCVAKKFLSGATKVRCPSCSSNLGQECKQTTVEFKLKLLSLNVRCSHGCGASFSLADLPEHAQICPYAPETCPNRAKGCKKNVRRCDLKKHLEECDYRTVECEACGFMTVYCELFTHQSRVRCLEKKLKQQVAREKRSIASEVKRHRDKIFKDHIRLEQQQRKKILDHSRAMNGKLILPTRNANSTESLVGFNYGKRTKEMTKDLALRDNVDAQTPHSSRSGFALMACRQCGKPFRSDANKPHSCRWHAGVYMFQVWKTRLPARMHDGISQSMIVMIVICTYRLKESLTISLISITCMAR